MQFRLAILVTLPTMKIGDFRRTTQVKHVTTRVNDARNLDRAGFDDSALAGPVLSGKTDILQSVGSRNQGLTEAGSVVPGANRADCAAG